LALRRITASAVKVPATTWARKRASLVRALSRRASNICRSLS